MSKSTNLPPALFSLMGNGKTRNICKTEDKVPICDDDTEFLAENTFENRITRNKFIQKVLLIKLLQRIGAIMVLFCFAVILPVELFVVYNSYWVVYIALASVAYIVLYGLLMFCDKARRKSPYKYMFLVAHTVTFVLFIGLLFGHYRMIPVILMVSLNYCMAIFSLLAYSIFAVNTKQGFVTGHGILIAGSVQIVVFALTVSISHVLNIYTVRCNPFYILYPSLVMTLHYIYMICDLQAMTTKNYHASITPDDYVGGVINLYIDYVYFFSSRVFPKLRQLWEKCSGGTGSIH